MGNYIAVFLQATDSHPQILIQKNKTDMQQDNLGILYQPHSPSLVKSQASPGIYKNV